MKLKRNCWMAERKWRKTKLSYDAVSSVVSGWWVNCKGEGSGGGGGVVLMTSMYVKRFVLHCLYERCEINKV